MRHKRKLGLLGIPLVMLVFAGGALAAWIVFQGLSGSGAGKVGASTISPKITLAGNAGLSTAAIPGTDGNVAADITNNGSGGTKILTLSSTTITATPSCDTSALSFSPSGVVGASGTVFAPGNTTGVVVGTLHAAANLDPGCANAAISIAFSGTTN